MRAIIQRVTNASVVTMDEMILSAIGAGLVVWVGMSRSDKQADIDFIIRQILNYQIYDKDEHTQWARTVVEMDYEILCLSEVSLYATTKGRFKPLFHNAMDSETAKVFFSSFVNELKQSYKPNKVRRGRYGTGSLVNAQFVGPVFSIQSSKKGARDGPISLNSLTNKPLGHRQRYSRPLYAQYLRPTRTIPLGVGKFYGKQAYYEQRPYHQQPYGYTRNDFPQPNVQYQYGNQKLYEQQIDNQKQYGWPNAKARYGQQNIQEHYHDVKQNSPGHYGGQQNAQGYYGRQQNPQGQYGEQPHYPDNYGGHPNTPNNYGGQQNPPGHYGGQSHSPDYYAGQQNVQGHYGGQPNSPDNYGGQLHSPGNNDGQQNSPGHYGKHPNSPDKYGEAQNIQGHYGGRPNVQGYNDDHQPHVQYSGQTYDQSPYSGQPYGDQITPNQQYNQQTGNMIPEGLQITTHQPVTK